MQRSWSCRFVFGGVVWAALTGGRLLGDFLGASYIAIHPQQQASGPPWEAVCAFGRTRSSGARTPQIYPPREVGLQRPPAARHRVQAFGKQFDGSSHYRRRGDP